MDNPTKESYGLVFENCHGAQFVSNVKADELAINTGFIKRRRKATTSFSFVKNAAVWLAAKLSAVGRSPVGLNVSGQSEAVAMAGLVDAGINNIR